MSYFTLSAPSLIGDRIVNPAGEDLGKIDDVMVDVPSGRIAYVVLSFGGTMGFGDKLFAVPWPLLKLNGNDNEFVLDVSMDMLKNAPGFDRENRSQSIGKNWLGSLYEHYKTPYYW